MTSVRDYEHNVISFDTDGGADAAMTVKVVGSIQEEQPDFAAPQTADNQYEFIYINDLEDSANNIIGDTGFVVATADDHRLFEANVSGLQWIGVLPTAGTAGEITVKVRKFSNQ